MNVALPKTGGLSVRDLRFDCGPGTPLAHVSLDAAPGRFCVLPGPDDAGKSTRVLRLTRLRDDPPVGPDVATRVAITDHVHDLAGQRLCVLRPTHLADKLRDGGARLVLHQGNIIPDATAGNIRRPAALPDRFPGRTKVAA